MSIQPDPTHPYRHDATHRSIGVAEAQCPYCGQPISRKEYREIQAKIANEERARIGKVEANLKARFSREKAQAETRAKAEIEKAKKDAAKAAEQQIKTVKASQEAAISQRLQVQRETLDKAKAKAVSDEKAL
jgi:hypothetical protein